MSYSFHIEATPTSEGGTFSMTMHEITLMRELMREVGAVSDTRTRATPGPPAHPRAAPLDRFRGNAGQLVTATECGVIASRLREHRDLTHDVASFFAGPFGAELDAWLAKWIAFNERAATAGGYRVR